jgi:hypothetical protein
MSNGMCVRAQSACEIGQSTGALITKLVLSNFGLAKSELLQAPEIRYYPFSALKRCLN